METLVNFLNGYWKPRMERLFAVDGDIVNEMKECLSNVRTHVWPERVQRFVSFGLSESENSCRDTESMCDAESDLSDENYP
ncbi:hypothetical protein NW767_005274 [Fusarium falciforme]|nr:hypothetical protein NW767_005274 [Fusarium falciforme]